VSRPHGPPPGYVPDHGRDLSRRHTISPRSGRVTDETVTRRIKRESDENYRRLLTNPKIAAILDSDRGARKVFQVSQRFVRAVRRAVTAGKN